MDRLTKTFLPVVPQAPKTATPDVGTPNQSYLSAGGQPLSAALVVIRMATAVLRTLLSLLPTSISRKPAHRARHRLAIDARHVSTQHRFSMTSTWRAA